MTATLAPARRLHDLPSPGGLPLLGNLLQLDIPKLHLVFERWFGEVGSPYLLRMGPKQVFVSDDPELLQQVLRERPERYRRVRQVRDCLAEIGADGMFSVEGEGWRPQRKLVMQALNATHFRGFFPAMQAITGRLQRRWRAAAERDQTVEMSHDLVRYTVDVTTALAFGEDPNTIERDGDAIQDHLALVFPMLFDRINAPLPYWRLFRLPKDRQLDRALAAIHAHVQRLIEQARGRMREAPSASPCNVLEAMLAARDEPGSGLTDADAVLGAATVAAGYDDVRKLDAFEATANEATRLKPIVPLLFFEPNEDVVLGGVALPAGTPLFFCLRPAMLDDRRFADAVSFRPERWAAGHGLQPHDTRAYMQFGAGSRVCPGRHLAAVEIRLVLSMPARSFTLELAADPASIREVMAFTMMPSAMPVRLVPR